MSTSYTTHTCDGAALLTPHPLATVLLLDAEALDDYGWVLFDGVWVCDQCAAALQAQHDKQQTDLAALGKSLPLGKATP